MSEYMQEETQFSVLVCTKKGNQKIPECFAIKQVRNKQLTDKKIYFWHTLE